MQLSHKCGELKINNSIAFFPRGNAKMKIFPEIGNEVFVIFKKHIIYTGFIVDAIEPLGYFIKIEKTEPVLIGKYFRRNWNLVKD